MRSNGRVLGELRIAATRVQQAPNGSWRIRMCGHASFFAMQSAVLSGIEMSEKNDYGNWNLFQLKGELERRNAKVHGRKGELIKRLEDYDATFNVENRQDEAEGIYMMKVPSAVVYKDVNASTELPTVTAKCFSNYLKNCEQRDSSVGSNMYKERFLCLRWSGEGEFTFFKGRVKSEYRKNVVYHVDLKVADLLIEECQCECTAGLGPFAHCKHVCTGTTLHALVDFNTSKTFICQETCTSQLQSFHKCKKFKASPIKANALVLKTVQVKSSVQDIRSHDPRPHQFRNTSSYNEYLRNLSINFTANYPSPNSIPILQLYPSAHLKAVYNDHDYFGSGEEKFLTSRKLKDVSTEDCTDVELKTRGQSEKPLWFAERSIRIPSSFFKRACHLTERTDTKQFLGQVTSGHELLSTPAIVHGRKYEAVAAKAYEELYSMKAHECGLFIRTEYPYLCASPDRVLDENELLEIKCPYSCRDEMVSSETVEYLYLCDLSGNLSLKTDHSYYYQIQGQLYCAERNVCRLVICTFRDMKVILVQRNEEFIKHMICSLKRFHNNHHKSYIINKSLHLGNE